MKKKICMVLMIMFALVSMWGCAALQRVLPRLQEPEIPEVIRGEEGEEPELKVFIAETEEVQTMKFEDYIAGVVAAEMEPEWNQEALAAQAILARTFTLQKISEKGGVPARDAHASTDIEEFQAYDAGRINDNVRQAVENTRGKVAVHNRDFIKSWFHAYSGPRTAFAREGLDYEGPEPDYIKIVVDAAGDIVPDKEREWQASFPVAKVREATEKIVGRDPGEVARVEIENQGPSGRVTLFLVNDVPISGPGLRLGLGSTEMRSTYLTDIKMEGGMLKMEGAGFGHGVGMCQWGARAMAEEGRSAEEIVKHFYENVEIVKMW